MNYQKILNDCVDELGRVNEGKGLGHDNPKLFTAETYMLLRVFGVESEKIKLAIQADMKETQITIGLWSRHSKKYRKEHKISQNTMSHDECNGIAISDLFINDGKKWCKDMLFYLKANSNSYNDAHPDTDWVAHLITKPIWFMRGAYNYFKAIKNNPTHQDEQDALFDKNIVALRYLRRPRDRGFYKYCSEKMLGPIEFLDFHFSWAYSLFFSYKEGDRNSGVLMNAMKLLALYHSKRILFPFKIFNKRMIKILGNKWLGILCERYFTNPYHPDKIHIITYFAKQLEGYK